MAVFWLVMVANLASSCILLLGNRWLCVVYGVSVYTLTFIQLLVLSVVTEVSHKLNLFNRRSIVLKDILALSVARCFFLLTLNNFLSTSSLVTHQAVKAMTVPLFFLWDAFSKGSNKSKFMKCFASAIVLLGATCLIARDGHLNLKSFLSGILFCIASRVHHSVTAKRQMQIGADYFQLSLIVFPLAALYLFPVVITQKFILDAGPRASSENPLAYLLCALLGLVASVEGQTGYLLQGKLNNACKIIFGESKFCLILLVGMWLFNEKFNAFGAASALLVITGTISYDFINARECPSKGDSAV